MNERREPFVAWMHNDDPRAGGTGKIEFAIYANMRDKGEWTIPAVVTPTLPGDPRPGDTGWTYNGQRAVILTAPFTAGGSRRVTVELGWEDADGVTFAYVVALSDLHRVPPEKTYRLDVGGMTQLAEGRLTGSIVNTVDLRAPSKEAALAKLADALEEVE